MPVDCNCHFRLCQDDFIITAMPACQAAHPLRDAHVWQFKCWLSALIRKPPDKRAKITVIWHVWYAYMYIPHIFPCRDWANLCDGRKQAWPDFVPHKKTCEKCRGLTFVRRFPAERGSFAGHTSLHRYIKYSLLVEIFDCTCYRVTARNVPLIWHMQPCRLRWAHQTRSSSAA